MTPALWTIATALIVGLGIVCALTARYDHEQRRRVREDRCGCPLHDAGGSCEVLR